MGILGLKDTDLPFNDKTDEDWKKGQDPRSGHPEDHNQKFHEHVDEILLASMSQELKKTKPVHYKTRDWIMVTGFSAILVIIDVYILYYNLQSSINPSFNFAIASVGIITFFGMLAISSFHKMRLGSLEENKKYAGTMRQALTGSLVCVYFIVLGMKISDNQAQVTDSVLSNFSTVIMIIMGFYFGTKVLEGLNIIKTDKTTNSQGQEKSTSDK